MSSSKKKTYANPFGAIFAAIRDIRSKEGLIPPSPETECMDGKTCLITGANTGLGLAIARQLAERGATLILACRSGIPETSEQLIAETGNPNITMEPVDLTDLHTVDALCARLATQGIQLDRLILNAGLMAQIGQKSAQGFEKMFAIHFLANQRLATTLAHNGVLPHGSGARVIAISSESHRSAPAFDLAGFGTFNPHKMSGAMKQYGHSKLALSLMVRALAQKLTRADGTPEISVFHMCPGPVNSSIVREAPMVIKPLVKGLMSAFFPSPDKAAAPAIYLTCSPDMDGRTGDYMHLMRPVSPSDDAINDTYAEAVFAFGERQFQIHLEDQDTNGKT